MSTVFCSHLIETNKIYTFNSVISCFAVKNFVIKITYDSIKTWIFIKACQHKLNIIFQLFPISQHLFNYEQI